MLWFKKQLPDHFNAIESVPLTYSILGDAGRGGYPGGEMLRHGGGIQRDGDGAAGAQPGGPFQFLQQVSRRTCI